MLLLLVQESTVSAFSQWQAAASGPDLPGWLADTAVVRSALLSISKVQATASQLAKTIADKTEAGTAGHATSCTLHVPCSHGVKHVLHQSDTTT